ANLASTLIKHDLIDEYRIMINPVILGNGISLFKPATERRQIVLIKSRTFRSGNVLLFYRSAK
ncbi:MAG: dihydrofolate reductase family protein, partial [Bacteroidota bacterium]|nr:dihydrofolate reductase family protein [Bacteroidota bacterium]